MRKPTTQMSLEHSLEERKAKTEVRSNWIVIWGEKKDERKLAIFDRWELALQFFKEKDRDGKHVTVYKETVIKNVEKIT